MDTIVFPYSLMYWSLHVERTYLIKLDVLLDLNETVICLNEPPLFSNFKRHKWVQWNESLSWVRCYIR